MKIVKKEVAYKGYSQVNLVTLEHPETGKQFTRELLERGSSVTVLLFDSKNDLFLTTSEFRIGESHLRSASHGLVAGMIDSGMNHTETAVKETLEESGLVINESDVKFLSKTFASPGITNEESFLCYADVDLSSVDTEASHGCESENEEIIVTVRPMSELKSFIDSNDLSTSAFSLLFLLLQKSLPSAN